MDLSCLESDCNGLNIDSKSRIQSAVAHIINHNALSDFTQQRLFSVFINGTFMGYDYATKRVIRH